MSVRLKGRRRSAAQVINQVNEWAHLENRVRAAALVGSYARGAERIASDVDFVILTDDPDRLADEPWFVLINPGARLVRSLSWGPVRERRYRLRNGLLVELGYAPMDWAALPLDAGTRRVLTDGYKVLYDGGVLSATGVAAVPASEGSVEQDRRLEG